MPRSFVIRSAAGAALVAAGWASAAGAPLPRAIAGLATGRWELREIDGGARRLLCVADRRALVQLAHAGATCTASPLEDEPARATIHYSCPGAGHGRTSITVEDAGRIHLQTQGIAGGAPFDLDYEGRRVGAC